MMGHTPWAGKTFPVKENLVGQPRRVWSNQCAPGGALRKVLAGERRCALWNALLYSLTAPT